MSEFKFSIFERVTVPGAYIEGCVTAASASGSDEPIYTLAWLKIGNVDGRAQLLAAEDEFKESRIAAAQPPKMITEAEAAKLADEARQSVTAELGNEIAGLRMRIDRMQANAARRAKERRAAGRKVTRNRKRR